MSIMEMKSSKDNVIKEIDDPWKIIGAGDQESFGKPWNELSTKRKFQRVITGILKGCAVLILLYFFVCSLDLLSLGFRIIGGKTTGKLFRQSAILQNPVVGVMVGVLTTVLVQSSSTSTSIVVGMVSAEFLTVKSAIPVVMGANIGTSVTNTIVSLMQAGQKDVFRRAFAGATVHDMFNWLSVVVILILEVSTHYMLNLSSMITEGLVSNRPGGGEVKLLQRITKPLVKQIVQIDKKVLQCWSNANCTEFENSSLIKSHCGKSVKSIETVDVINLPSDDYDTNVTDSGLDYGTTEAPSVVQYNVSGSNAGECSFLFANTSLSDGLIGTIILVCSLIVLCSCLIGIVKVLNSVLKGQIAIVIKKTLNAKVPYIPWITGYIALFVGALMTFLIQSSSVFTSALTPLVGLGVLTVERVYPLTLGANIGTTTTAILASLAVEGKTFRPALQVALCHLLFNISGVLLFYPIPFMRFPIRMAKFLGDTTAKYRWFAIVYMIATFFVMPAVFMALSFAGTVYVIVVAVLIVLLFLFVSGVNFARVKCPKVLPEFLHSWKWLPVWLRSLQPYDKIFSRLLCCKKLKSLQDNQVQESGTKDPHTAGNINLAFEEL